MAAFYFALCWLTLYWTSELVKNWGDHCGAQVRLSSTSEQCNTTHNSEHSSFDHLKMNQELDKTESSHYCNILSRNKERLTATKLWRFFSLMKVRVVYENRVGQRFALRSWTGMGDGGKGRKSFCTGLHFLTFLAKLYFHQHHSRMEEFCRRWINDDECVMKW